MSKEEIIIEAYNQLELGFDGNISGQSWEGYSLGIVALTKALLEKYEGTE